MAAWIPVVRIRAVGRPDLPVAGSLATGAARVYRGEGRSRRGGRNVPAGTSGIM